MIIRAENRIGTGVSAVRAFVNVLNKFVYIDAHNCSK